MKFNPFTMMKLSLAIFMGVGLGLTIFMIMQDVKIVGAYVVSGLFVLGPGILLYGFTFGFSVSEKTMKKQAERQESVTFDQEGIACKMPLFDTTQFMNWNTIETVIYTNYQSDDHSQFIFYLTQAPSQIMEERPWFLNRLFPFAFRNRKEISIKDDCKNFQQIPEMLQKYLIHAKPIDFSEDPGRGTLISSKTTIKNNTISTEEHWQPNNNYERVRVVFDRYNRTFQQIQQTKSAR